MNQAILLLLLAVGCASTEPAPCDTVVHSADGSDQTVDVPQACGASVLVTRGSCARITFAADTGRHYVGYERDFQYECAMVKANDADLPVEVSPGAASWLRVETAAIPADQPDSCPISCD